MTQDERVGLLILGIYGFIFILLIISFIMSAIGNWRLFQKANQPAWFAIIPILAGFTKHKITFGEDNKWLYFIGWVISIYFYYTRFCFVRAFGGPKGLAVLSLFFPGITTLILAFDKAYRNTSYQPILHFLK
ncbi:DUF5684 domain-containing protein [Streptococcus pseudoporcinus]|uniref:Hypothetical membrane associated protein n=1 Tax=Streptococcus pseudoporcinus TaxID=361101 RepID=A0A4U9XY48_9STRE|nr:DUF5684 domain-containing protein [Streptococcus pseudoporcinus]VTS18489.1 hypothetical membrane associated protein [Streptococcus pseudoporcinus]VUC68619.1 hypothetical membrane associated protein [Streptococcus pseudoporcinus]VUC99346.1 hypothetical membrane associated protein [Streptococcus pseudoporcinus]VUC99738.1 hypothetical membrane associated protein [Streptococcus pseudoporcinus]